MTNKTPLLLLTGVVCSIGLCAIVTGCTIKKVQEEDSETAADAVEGESADGGDEGGEKKDPPAGSSSGGSSSGGSSSGGSSSGGTPAKDGGTPAKDGGAEGGGAAACLDDTAPAAPTACPTLGAGDQCKITCDNFAASWKRGLANDIRKCLTAPICQGGTATCSDKALAKACADATATAFCTPNVTGCKAANGADTITQATCEGIAKGLTTAGRANLRTCFEQELNCGDCPAKFK